MKKFGYVLFGIAGILLFGLSCKIGLGPAIDTQAPELIVTHPVSDSVIRDKIAFLGSFTDDGVIKSVTVTLNSTNESQEGFIFDASLDETEKEGNWSCIVDPKDSENPIPDGTYEAAVVITDSALHTTTITRLFTIDNTPPLVVLQRPSSKDSSSAADRDSYGQTFTLEGQAADDNNVDLIEVSFYSEPECQNLLGTVKKYNVPPTISLDVAKFEEGIENDYSKIYGSTKKEGTKSFYCKIVAYDGSQKYPIDGSEQSEADKKGNAVSHYYLYDDISIGVLDSYKITEVYHMLNGSYTNSNGERAADIISSVKTTLKDNIVSVGSFSLNPANNPTFLVSGKDQLRKDGKDFSKNEDYYISNGSTVVVEVSQGLDGIPLDGDSLKVYVRECNEYGIAVAGAPKIYPVTTRSKSGSSYKFVTEINTSSCKALTLGTNYVFGVDGTDTASNVVMPAGNGFGFHFASSGAAPVLTISTPADNISYVKKGETVTFNGTAIVEDGIPVVTIANGKNPIYTSSFTAANGTLMADGKTEYAFSYTVPKDSTGFVQTESKQYNFTIKASKDGNASQATKTVMYDVEGPEASIQSVTPIAHKYPADESSTPEAEDYLNKSVTFMVSIADKFDTVDTKTNKPYLIFTQNGTEVLRKEITNPLKQEITVNTEDAEFTQKAPITVSILSYDRAGNVNLTTADSSKNFIIDQSTDKPVVLPNDNTKFSAKFETKADVEEYNGEEENKDKPKNKISAGNGVSLRIIDDDGVAKVSTRHKKDDSSWSSPINVPVANLTDYSYTYTSLPTQTGFYQVEVTVTDKLTESQTVTFAVQVVAAAPIISVSNPSATSFVKAGDKVVNRITIDSDSVPFKLYRTTKSDTGLNWENTQIADNIGNPAYPEKCKQNSDGHFYIDDEITINSTQTYYYQVTDNSPSNSNVVSIINKVDDDKPTVTLEAVPSKDETKGISYTFSGTSSDGEGSGIAKVELTIKDKTTSKSKTVTVNGTEDWSYTLKFDDAAWAELFAADKQGEKEVTVQATDKVGNKSDKFTFGTPASEKTSVSFTFDKADPILTVNGVQSFIPKDGITLSGTAKDTYKLAATDALTITEYDNGTKGTSKPITVDASGNWTCAVPFNGTNNKNAHKFKYEITLKDAANNSVTYTSTEMVVDTALPVITFDNDSATTVYSSSTTLKVTGTITDDTFKEAHAYLYKKDNNVWSQERTHGNIELSSTGTFEWSAYNLDDGEYRVMVQAWDKAGNIDTTVTPNVDYAEQVTLKSVIIDNTPATSTVYATSGLYDEDGNAVAATYQLLDSETYYAKAGYTISGTITEDNFDKSKVTLSVTKGNNTVTAPAITFSGADSKVWTFNGVTAATKDGTYRYTLSIQDKANHTTKYVFYVVYDESAPTLAVTNPEKNINFTSAAANTIKAEGTFRDTGIGLKAITYTLHAGTYNKQNSDWTWTIVKSVSEDIADGNTSFAKDMSSMISTNGEGKYKFTASVKDKLDHETNSGAYEFFYDQNAPTLVFNSLNSNYKENKVTVSGTVSDTNALKSLVVKDGETVVLNKDYTAQKTTSDNWEKELTALTEGSHHFVVTATDMADRSTVKEQTIIIDTKAPDVTLDTIPTTGEDTKARSFTIRGTAKDDTTGVKDITVVISDVKDSTKKMTVKPTVSENWFYTITYSDATSGAATVFAEQGEKKIEVTAEDIAGNKLTTAVTKNFVYDKADPILEVTASTIQTYMPQSGFTIKGTANDSYKLNKSTCLVVTEEYKATAATTTWTEKEKDHAITVGSDDSWTLAVPINPAMNGSKYADGIYRYTFTLTDTVGNAVLETTKQITVDTTAPTLTITAPTTGTLITEVYPKFEGKFTESVELKNIYFKFVEGTKNNGTYTYTAPTVTSVASFDGSWSTANTSAIKGTNQEWHANQQFKQKAGEGSGLPEGFYKLFAYAVDEAGNYTATAATAEYKVDMAAPVISSVKKDSQTGTELSKDKEFYYNTADGKLKLSGKILESNGLASFTYKVGGAAAQNITMPAAAITEQEWSAEITGLSQNTSTPIVISATDIAGQSSSVTYTVYWDTVAPVISIITPDKDYSVAEDNSISWSGDGDGSYHFKASVLDDAAGIPENKYKYLFTQTRLAASEINATKVTNEYTGQSFTSDQTLVTGNGKARLAATLNEGQWYLYIYAEDAVGNKAGVERSFYVDKAAPAITTKLDKADLNSTALVTKTSNYSLSFNIAETNGLATSTPVTVSVSKGGVAMPSSAYKVYYTPEGGSKTEATNYKTDVDYTIELTSAQADDDYVYTITATDLAGKTTTISRTIRLDTAGPSIDTSSPNFDNWITSKSIQVIGTANDISGIKGLYYVVNPASTPTAPAKGTDALTAANWTGKTPAWTAITAGSNWTIDLPSAQLADKSDNKLYLAAVDNYGNITALTAGSIKTIKIDTIAPTLEEDGIGTSGAKITNANASTGIILSGTFKDSTSGLSSLSVQDDDNETRIWTISDFTKDISTRNANGTTWEKSTGKWTQKIEIGEGAKQLPNGVHLLNITATDIAGNKSQKQRSIQVDTQVPSSGTLTLKASTVPDYTENGRNWFKTTSIGIQLPDVEDRLKDGFASGITTVEYSTNAANSTDSTATWIGMTKGTETTDTANGNVKKATWTADVNCTSQGLNTIRVRVMDAAGNIADAGSLPIYIDTKVPETASLVKIDSKTTGLTETKFVNGENAIEAYILTEDVSVTETLKSSGIAKVKLAKIGTKAATNSADGTQITYLWYNAAETTKRYYTNTLTPIANTTKAYTDGLCTTGEAAITAYDLTNKSITVGGKVYSLIASSGVYKVTINADDFDSGTAVFSISDNVNNNADETKNSVLSLYTFQIQYDNEYPEAKITSVPAAINKTVTIGGTARDNQTLTELKVQYVESSADGIPKSGASWQNYPTDPTGTSSWTLSINTEEKVDGELRFKDETYYTFRAVATDTANNVGNSGKARSENKVYDTANQAVLYVNQDSDRPEITITNITLANMLRTTPVKFGASRVMGLITDDDGVSTEAGDVQYKVDSGAWTNLALTNGLFSFDLEDGSKSVFFKVKDSAGKTFTSSDAVTYSVDTPIITDGTNSYATKPASGTTTASGLYLKIDTRAPSVNAPEYTTKDTPAADDWKESINTALFGGTNNTFDLRQFATDANGIESVTATFERKSGDLDTLTDASYTRALTKATNPTTKTINSLEYTGYQTETPFDVTGFASGTRELTISVFDGSNTARTILNVSIDNTAPTLTFESHKNGDVVNSSFFIRGNIKDGDNKTTVKMLVSSSPTKLATTDRDWASATELLGTTSMTWGAYFDGEIIQDGFTHFESQKNKFIELYGTSQNIELNSDNAIVNKTTKAKYRVRQPFYFHMLVTDGLGNPATEVFNLVVDPQGDVPVITLVSPNADETIQSGWIRLSGTAYDDKTIKGLYVEVDPNYDGTTFIPWSATHKPPRGATIESIYPSDGDNPYELLDERVDASKRAQTRPTTKAIYIGDSLSWNIALNKQNELIGAVNGNTTDNNDIAVRFYAVDVDGNISEPTTPFKLTIDSAAPKIGSSEPFYLKQFDNSGNVTASIEYVDGMWLKGEWYLVGSVEDESGINAVTISKGENDENPETLTTATGLTSKTWDATKTSGYVVKYKVGNANANEAGELKYILNTEDKDATKKSKSKEFIINYDNKPSVLSDLDRNDVNVQNSNGFYTLRATASEGSGESGFERIVFFFTRGTKVYDSYLGKLHAKNTLDTGAYVTEDHIYWTTNTVSAISGKNITLDAANDNAHVGGIAKLGGTVYRITAISETTVTLDGNPSSDMVGKTIMFAIGHVVDHLGAESAGKTKGTDKTAYGNGYYSDMRDDDGDRMIETVSTQGTVTTWSGSINSQNIPDGPITIHYVAYDKAGNVAHKEVSSVVSGGKTYAATVCNNAPRLAGVKIWTDFDGNGSPSDSEYTYKYVLQRERPINGSRKLVSTMVADSDFVVTGNGFDYDSTTTAPTAIATLRDTSSFTPELVGGNGDLYYTYKIGTKDQFVAKSGYIMSGHGAGKIGTGRDQGEDITTVDDNQESYIDAQETSPIPFDKSNFGTGTGKITSNGMYWFEYTIWDSTEGCTAWTDDDRTAGRLSATMRLAVNVDYFDQTAPVAYIRPFHWNSKDDNSVSWNNGVAKGHIELEADLPSSFTTGGSGVNDRDPKVSGEIKIDGYAYDNIRLKQLKIGFNNTTKDDATLAAEHTESGWSDEGSSTAGWSMSVTDVFANSDGHFVHWVLTVDTEKLVSTLAAVDQKIKILAVDERGSNSSDFGTSQTNNYVTASAWGSISSEDKKAKTYYTDPECRTIATSNTSNSTVVYLPTSYTWGSVKNQTNANKIYYVDPTCTKSVTVTTKDEVVVYKNTMTAYYQMDVVPYVTELSTTFTEKDPKIKSLYGRTALGQYPVYYHTTNDAGTSNVAELITVKGFNLENSSVHGTVTLAGTSNNTATLSNGQFTIPSGAISGEMKVTVNNIDTLNNINNNEGKGIYTFESGTDEYTKYSNFYNRQPNNANNAKLTDNLELAIWQINSRAAQSYIGGIEQPVMHINPNNGMLGFAFAHGNDSFAMPNGNTNSYSWWGWEWDKYNAIEFVYDQDGYTYGTAAGRDTASDYRKVSRFRFHTSRWGNSLNGMTRGGSGSDAKSAYGNTNALRLEYMGTNPDTTAAKFIADAYRINSPSMAVNTSGTNTNVYLAYFDQLTNEIRFRAGTLTNTTTSRTAFGQFQDECTAGNGTTTAYSPTYTYVSLLSSASGANQDSNAKPGNYVSISVIPRNIIVTETKDKLTSDGQVAGSITDTTRFKLNASNTTFENKEVYILDSNLFKIGEATLGTQAQKRGVGSYYYYEIPTNAYKGTPAYIVLKDDNAKFENAPFKYADSDVVVAVWFDSYNRNLWYSYNTNPLGTGTTNIDATTHINKNWSRPTAILTGTAGGYCKVAVDTDGHIHIASYSTASSGSLVYTRLEKYDSTPRTCTVDSYGITGQHLTLDFAKDTNGNVIPYIGYYMASMAYPKLAYLVDTQTDTTNGGNATTFVPKPGVDAASMYTGAWENVMVPSKSVIMQDKVSVGVYRNKSTGVIQAIPSAITGKTVSAGTDSGVALGNGTTNPILAYGITYGTKGYIETAQLK